MRRRPEAAVSGDRDGQGVWVFGYGSLVWRPDFPHLERRVGHIGGWRRRLWQGSPDHRGQPHAPGRVATLVTEPEAVCWGVAYRVAEADWSTVVDRLDARESGGFERHEVRVALREPSGTHVRAQWAVVLLAGAVVIGCLVVLILGRTGKSRLAMRRISSAERP